MKIKVKHCITYSPIHTKNCRFSINFIKYDKRATKSLIFSITIVIIKWGCVILFER